MNAYLLDKLINHQFDQITNDEWCLLLIDFPTSETVRDNCNWDQLNGDNWERILLAEPAFQDRCHFEKLSKRNWVYLTTSRLHFDHLKDHPLYKLAMV